MRRGALITPRFIGGLLQSPLPIMRRFAANDFELSPIHAAFSVCEARKKVGVFSKVPFSYALIDLFFGWSTSRNSAILT
jgi:hypothetical protein